MTAFDTSTDRFLRPDDLHLLRRNRRQIQFERLLHLGGRLLFALLVVYAAWWMFQRTRRDSRFAVQAVEISGVKHTGRDELARLTGAYVGSNLFGLDIERVQGDLRSLAWVERVAIEKKLPGTLKISVVERDPVALASIDGTLRYVDSRGVPFAELSPVVGNPDLPLVSNAQGTQIRECVELLRLFRMRHPAIYSRISEISPAEDGFVVFDRDLKTKIYLSDETAAEKWATLYAVAPVEGYHKHPVEYVDLRFADRIIVKPQPLAPGETR